MHNNIHNGFQLNAQSKELGKSSVNGIIRSEYTPLDSESCGKTIEFNDGTSDSRQACPGYDNIPIFVNRIDGRQIDIGGNTIVCLGWDFNLLGEKLEWRLRDNEPFAAIYRYYIDDGFGKHSGSSVLVVVKISGSAGDCIAGVVDGNPNANELARRFADEKIAGFECGVDNREEILSQK